MKCIRCGAEIANNDTRCTNCSLEFTDEMKQQMIAYDVQMAEYNRQMEDYNRQMAAYNNQMTPAGQPGINNQMMPAGQPGINNQMTPAGQPGINNQMPPVGQPGINNQMTPAGQPGINRQTPQMGAAPYTMQQPQTKPEKKKGLPNIITMIGAVIAVASAFLPYAKQGNTTNSLWSVFGGELTAFNIVILSGCFLLVLGALVCSFFNNVPCNIVNFVCSVILAGVLIFEFVLAVIDKGRYDNASLSIGATMSVIAAAIMIVAVPIWSIINKHNNSKNA
ncbi:MAG: hypothetical protein ACI4EF_07330 [Coprococcus sp.]